MSGEWIAVLDPGTAQIRVGLYRLGRNGRPGEIHLGQVPSHGIRRGIVEDPAALARAIRTAFSQLADHSRIEVRSVHVAWRFKPTEEGGHVPRRRAYRGVLPQEMVDAGRTGAQFADPALDKALTEAGITPERWFCVGDVSARGAATASELERRVLCLDIGSGIADWALLEAGRWVDAGRIPVGGDHFTSDLAAFTQLSLADAERLKHGLAALASGQDQATLGEQLFSIADLRLVLEARATDLCDAVGGVLRERFAADLVLLNGGASQLHWLPEFLSGELRIPVRRGMPRGIGGQQVFPADPGWCAVSGMIRTVVNETRASTHVEHGILDILAGLWAAWWHRG